MTPIRPGRIVWMVYPESRGGGKPRPMVVTTRVADIRRTGQFFAVVCSTDFEAGRLHPNEVPIPQAPCTRLDKPTVAVCDWTATFAVSDVDDDDDGGFVPTVVFREICRVAGITYVPER